MGNELAIYQRMSNPLEAVNVLGTAIAKSKMFGCESIDQGQVLALECLTRGIAPLALAERYHVVEGKLMMRYDAMLAEFHVRGGKHRQIERTADAAEIELTHDGQTIRERCTWADMQQEPTPFKGDGKTLKKNWATPRARRQMLWARAVSEGVRAILPDVNCGRYVPEEMDVEITDPPVGGAASEVNGEAAKWAAGSQGGQGKVTGAATAKPAPQADTPGEVIDAEYEVKGDAKAPAADQQKAAADAATARATTAAAAPNFTGPISSGPMCTSEQQKSVTCLWQQLGVTKEQAAAQLAKRNVKELWQLTVGEATELIDRLGKALADQLVGQSKADPTAEVGYTWEPIGQALRDEIMTILSQISDKGILRKIKEKLVAAGLDKVADLSQRDGERLRNALVIKNMEEFFGASLARKSANGTANGTGVGATAAATASPS